VAAKIKVMMNAFLSKIKSLKIDWLILFILLASALVLRVIFLPVLGFHGDFQIFNIWASELSKYGISKFYENSGCNYLPLYVYILKFSILIQPLIRHLNLAWTDNQVVWISYKFPCLIFDLLTAYFIYLFIFKQTKNKLWGALGAVIYLFHPALFHNTYIYGQNNVLMYFPTILLLYTLSEKKYYWAGFSLALLLLVKPTSIIILPFIVVLFILGNKKDYQAYLKFFLSAYLFVQILILPFYFRLPWNFAHLFFQFLTTGNPYKVTMMYSYNLWFLLTGSAPVPDSVKFLGRSYHFWGLLMFSVSYLISLLLLLYSKTKGYLILIVVIYFSFFVFPTRVHEGYLLFAFPVFALAVFIYKDSILAILYLLSTLAYSYNLFSYWPSRLSNYMTIYYDDKYASGIAYFITLMPAILLIYFILYGRKKSSNLDTNL
jgi:Gpi18-like mannosyltransferase